MSNEGRRYDLGKGELTNDKKTFPLWHYGIVIDIEDPFDAGRIKVRIYPLDNDVPTIFEDFDIPPNAGGMPWCEPLLPKFLNVVPKVGEMVKIITFDYRNKKIRRQYIGPVIGQQTPSDFNESNYNDARLKVENNGYTSSWSLNPAAIDGEKSLWKIYPDKEDIAFLGRKNTDIILRDQYYYNEVILRSGKIDPKSLNSVPVDNVSQVKLNIVNPAYLTINFTQADALSLLNSSADADIKKLNLDKDRSHVNVVADKVNLISHIGSQKRGQVTPAIIKGDNVARQIDIENTQLHPLVYGDVIWEFLSVLRPYIEGHIHKGSRREPDGDITKNNLLNWFNSNMGVASSKPTTDGKDSYVEIENCGFLSKGVKTN